MRYKVTEETYKAVLERDKCCVLCHSTVALQLHHIDGRSRLKTNDINNCVMLCYICHQRVHENQKRFRPMLKMYIQEVKENESDKTR